MPSFTHEALLVLFRNRPTLAAEVLGDAVPRAVAASSRVEVADSNLTAPVPVERAADLVLLFSEAGVVVPRLAVIVEVQLEIDPDKTFSWWSYIVNVRARHRCPTCLVVVAPSKRVARWAREPIETGHPGAVLAPLVIGPSQIPVVRDPEEAKANPELAVLSAMAHGKTEAADDVARAVYAAVAPLDAERSSVYLDAVSAWLAAGAAGILEELMANGSYQYQSDFAKRYFGQGKAEGKAEGQAEGAAASLLKFLDARHIPVDAATRSKILACTDLAQLDTWIARAATAATATEVIEG